MTIVSTPEAHVLTDLSDKAEPPGTKAWRCSCGWVFAASPSIEVDIDAEYERHLKDAS